MAPADETLSWDALIGLGIIAVSVALLVGRDRLRSRRRWAWPLYPAVAELMTGDPSAPIARISYAQDGAIVSRELAVASDVAAGIRAGRAISIHLNPRNREEFEVVVRPPGAVEQDPGMALPGRPEIKEYNLAHSLADHPVPKVRVALALAFLGIVTMLGPILCLPAAWCAHRALDEMKQLGSTRYRTRAQLALVMSYGFSVIWVAGLWLLWPKS